MSSRRSTYAPIVDQLMREAIARDRIPGMSLAIATPEGTLFTGADGYADLARRRPTTPQDQFPWFSMTKIATATAAVGLHAGGRLDLDAPIGSYLPKYRPHPRHGHPTTRHLLTHTAGLANPLPVRWVHPENEPPHPSFVHRTLARHGTPVKPVGAQGSYSNIGYLLAAEVIRAVTGRPIEDCVQDTVLGPLGMRSTGYRYDPAAPRAIGYVRMPRILRPGLRRLLPHDIVGPQTGGYTSLHPFLVNGAGYGGLVGTAGDAALLAAAHATAATDPHPVLQQQDIETMRRITIRGKRFDHGLGWFRRPEDASRIPGFVEHYGTGGGFWNAMRVYPDARLAIVAVANTTAAWQTDRLFTQLKGIPWNSPR